jgi:D-alanyl-lipoteichoic acid acyltransferase DltB (MBOAT superfamily)
MAAGTAAIAVWAGTAAVAAAAKSARTRRNALLVATIAIGPLLGLRYETARRLSALLFLPSIALVFLVWRAAISPARRTRRAFGAVAAVVGLFVLWKAASLQSVVYRALHVPQRYLLAGAWLGGSYILFRLIHVAIEAGKPGFPAPAFPDFALYVLFPPTLLAGPIARLPEFSRNFAYARPRLPDAAEGGRRILVGVFKKFVVADFIALLPIDVAHGALSTPRLWASLYLFGFQLFFDFAGYCDIAIGAAALAGFSVPENFHSPYIQPNITRFWQSWHATLSGWMRDYVFFPLGRLLRRRAPRLPSAAAALVCQTATMVVIGLWHGLFAGYAVWGLWHGVGLFLHREWARRPGRGTPAWARVRRAASTALTFQFVMTGWVFFYGASLAESLDVLRKLAGGRF